MKSGMELGQTISQTIAAHPATTEIQKTALGPSAAVSH
jgi:hypothetical protein